MKKLFLFTILFYYIVFSEAQERFFNSYPGWKINYVDEYFDDYLLYGSDTLYSGYSNTPIRIKINKMGEYLESFRYVSDSIYGFSIYSSDSYSIHDGYTMASGVYKEFLKDYVLNPILMYFNNTNYYCDSIKEFKSDFDERSTIIRFHREVNNKIHLFGTSMYDAEWNEKTFFAVYDPETGDFTMKDYSKPSHCVMTPYQALPTPDGGYLIACEQDMTYQLEKKVYACILKIDNNGDEQWRYIIHGQLGQSPWPDFEPATFRPRIFNALDGNYWVVWTDPLVPISPNLQSNPNSSIRIAKLEDTITGCVFTGEKNLITELENPSLNYYLINDSYQAENGDIYLLVQNYWGYNSAFVKIHSSGVGAWLRTYQCYPDDDADITETALYGICPTEDNGFMLTGKFYSTSSTLFPSGMIASCVFKTDSCGCFDAEGCNSHCADSYAEYYVNMAEASIFPNPACNKLSASFEYSGAVTEFTYKIYNLNGQLLMEGKSEKVTETFDVEVDDLPSGYYMIQFWGGGKIFTGKFVKE